jgi:hypothetical protein
MRDAISRKPKRIEWSCFVWRSKAYFSSWILEKRSKLHVTWKIIKRPKRHIVRFSQFSSDFAVFPSNVDRWRSRWPVMVRDDDVTLTTDSVHAKCVGVPGVDSVVINFPLIWVYMGVNGFFTNRPGDVNNHSISTILRQYVVLTSTTHRWRHIRSTS